MAGIGIGISSVFKKGGGGAVTVAAPTGLTLTVDSASQISGTFTINASDYDGNYVYYSTDDISYNLLDTLIGDENYFEATSLSEATEYYFRIVTYYGSIESDPLTGNAVTFNSAMVAGWNFDEVQETEPFSVRGADSMLNIYHAAQYYNGKTYIAYHGFDDTPWIIVYTHAIDSWSDPVQISTDALAVTDDHGNPCILIDSSGYIHCMFGCHNSAVYYSKSDNPEDITAWTAQASPAAVCTYPQLLQLSNGDIYFFYRSLLAPDDLWGYKVSDDGGATWGAYTSLSEDFAYCYYKKGVGDIIHCVMYGDQTTSIARKNIYYMYFNGTNWKNIGGTNLSLPLTLADSASIIAYNSGNYYIPNLSIHWDNSNNPYLLYSESTIELDATNVNLKLLKYNGSSWVSSSLGLSGDWVHQYVNAIDVIDSNNIYAYVLQQDAYDTSKYHAEEWHTINGGTSWTKVQTILSSNLHEIVKVNDYNSVGKIVLCTYNANDYLFYNKGYLWGSGGIVSNSNTAYAHYATDVKGVFYAEKNAPMSPIAGKYGNCYSFTGNPVALVVGDNDLFSFVTASPDDPFSVSFWVNTADTNVWQHILSKGRPSYREWEVLIYNNTMIIQTMHTAGTVYRGQSAPFTTTNAWVHFICTYDGSGATSGFKIYMNNVEVQNTARTAGTYTGMTNTTSNLFIGSYALGNYWLVAKLDHVRIWNKVLSDDERLKVYTNVAGW